MRALTALLCALVLSACKHPLEIRGEGDIVERLQGLRGCTYEEFRYRELYPALKPSFDALGS